MRIRYPDPCTLAMEELVKACEGAGAIVSRSDPGCSCPDFVEASIGFAFKLGGPSDVAHGVIGVAEGLCPKWKVRSWGIEEDEDEKLVPVLGLYWEAPGWPAAEAILALAEAVRAMAAPRSL